MNLDYTEHIPENFAQDSKVWVYQSNRVLTIPEALEAEEMFKTFLGSWNAHGASVKGYVNLLFGQFIIVMADETTTTVSGCSTDSSVRMIKELEHRFHIQLFNRQLLAFVIKDKIQMLPLNQVEYAIENGFLSAETLFFNNMVATKKELLENWIVPISRSWLAQRLELSSER